jgi:tetratricopeptide (TPR) repeat protein
VPISQAGQWDTVFCRNVTIYFKADSTARVVGELRGGLIDGGYLFLGHSETLATVSTGFESVERDGVFLYRKRASLCEGPKTRARPAVSRSAGGGLSRPQIPSDPVPSCAETELAQARAHAERGDTAAAAEACARALAINPLLPAARYLLGMAHMRSGDVATAERELRKTVYVDPGFALAHLNIAAICREQRRWDEAARSFEAAVEAVRSQGGGTWRQYLGGFDEDVLVRTAQRGSADCRKASGAR